MALALNAPGLNTIDMGRLIASSVSKNTPTDRCQPIHEATKGLGVNPRPDPSDDRSRNSTAAAEVQ